MANTATKHARSRPMEPKGRRGVPAIREEKEELTRRQRMILNRITAFWDTNGYSPSMRDLIKVTKIKTLNGILCHIKALERKGWITREPNIARSIRVL